MIGFDCSQDSTALSNEVSLFTAAPIHYQVQKAGQAAKHLDWLGVLFYSCQPS